MVQAYIEKFEAIHEYACVDKEMAHYDVDELIPMALEDLGFGQ